MQMESRTGQLARVSNPLGYQRNSLTTTTTTTTLNTLSAECHAHMRHEDLLRWRL